MTMAEYMKSQRETPAQHAERIAEAAADLKAARHAQLVSNGRWDK